jgi:hypothetical protein
VVAHCPGHLTDLLKFMQLISGRIKVKNVDSQSPTWFAKLRGKKCGSSQDSLVRVFSYLIFKTF